MELATGGERTIDGIADGRRVVLGHPKTREAMRAGLAMYFVTLDDPGLDELAERIVAELEIEWFFNIQLVGEHVIEVNPRISTIVYQEDLNLPYLGVKRALGEITDDELAGAEGRVRPGRTALSTSTSSSGTRRAGSPARPALGTQGRPYEGVSDRPLRVVHCPVNTAGIPWTNVQALRRRGVDARLVVFERYRLHPEADWSLERRGGFLRRQATQWRALARLLPRTDVFHFVLRPHARPAVGPVRRSCGRCARSR